MFSNKDFKAWGKENAILFASVMTKIEDRKDDDLLRTYEFRGFPSMAILGADGTAITKKVPRDLYSMSNIVAAASDYAKLSAEVEAGSKVDQKKWLMAQLGMGKINAKDAKAMIASTGISGKTKARAEGMLFVLEMAELASSARGRDVTAEAKMAACQAVYDAFKTGMRLPAGAAPESFVDDMLIDAAKSNKDGVAFAHAYERVKARHLAQIETMKGYLPRYRADLEKNKDDEKELERTKSTLKRIDEIITEAKQKVTDLEALAKQLKA
ncbi:MAG: hypothetical protein ACI8UD_001944 [Planctomycetota bacterium]